MCEIGMLSGNDILQMYPLVRGDRVEWHHIVIIAFLLYSIYIFN